MDKPCIYIETRITARIEFPDDFGPVDDGEGNVTKAAREKAWEVFADYIPQSGGVFFNGEDNDPAEVSIEVDEADPETEVWAE